MQLTKDTAAESLRSLQFAQTIAQKLLILRTVKNTLTGHELRKIEFIRAGIFPCIVELVRSLDNLSENDGHNNGQAQERDTIWLHCASITAVVANAGTVYTKPILTSGLIPILLDQLSKTSTAKVRLIVLRALNAIASNLPLQSEKDWIVDQSVAKCIYQKMNVDCITRIIADSDTTLQNQQVKEAALALICKTCSNENQKTVMVDAGLLEVLCTQLSQFITMDQFQENNAASLRRADDHVPRSTVSVSLILEVVGLLIEKSRKFAEFFAKNSHILSALSNEIDHVYTRTLLARNSNYCSINQALSMPAPQHLPTKIDVLLPEIMDVEGIRAARRSSFPPLDGTSSCVRRCGATNRTSTERSHDNSTHTEDTFPSETLVIPWLLYLSRSSMKRKRMIAARLLAILKYHGFLQLSRVRSLAPLLVPVLVAMLDTIHDVDLNPTHDMKFSLSFGYSYSYLAPSILALLVRDQEYLQKAAVDCKAIAKLSTALKANLEISREISPNLWWPYRLHDKLTDGSSDSCLGRGGPSQRLRFMMRLREGLLQALAALSPDNDSYRKEVCEQGALNAIILALEPFQSQVVHNKYFDQLSSHGNSPEVLVAACGAIRALSRSPTTLRTKLADADISKVVIKLLYTANPEVRISATMVLANLSHDFSPIKQSISDAGVVRKLCEQAHSANARLRLESLFTLKALVTNSSNKLKKLIVDELGCSWIRYLVATDPHDVPQGEVIGLVQKDFRKGSMIRLQTIDQDYIMEDLEASDFEEPDLEAYNKHSLQEDLDIQAEMLAFLRNLTTGESVVEIIDYLFNEIGQEDLMQAVIDRLRDKIQASPHVAGQLRRSSLVPPATVVNTLYVVTHLAASDRKYRMMLCNNTPLMRQISTLFNSDDSSVRSACCWVVINLIYPVPAGNGLGAGDSIDIVMARAKELQRLGIRNVVRRMEKTEQVVDVRERAATAAECFGKLLDRG